MLLPYLSSIVVFMLSAPLIILTVHPLHMRSRCTRLASGAHPYSVQNPRARVNRYLHSFILDTGKLWNELALFSFPSYDLESFKRGVPRHLSNAPELNGPACSGFFNIAFPESASS